MSWKKFISDYLTFSRRDRIGVIALLVLLVLIYLLPHFFHQPAVLSAIKEDSVLVKTFVPVEKPAEVTDAASYKSERYYKEPKGNRGFEEGTLFTFDPNTLSTDGWRRLGLNDHTIQTIAHYVAKGGRFRQPADLQKIWGMPAGFYERVAPYIQIENKPVAHADNNYSSFVTSKRAIEPVDINAGDTSAFIALPGIGSRLANRIIHFREKLGGFYSIEQIGETYGLSDSAFQLIKPYLNAKNTNVKKININTATKDELSAHPYIKWNLANVIVQYRNQHGPFASLTDLKNITLFTEDVYKKLTPYLFLQ